MGPTLQDGEPDLSIPRGDVSVNIRHLGGGMHVKVMGKDWAFSEWVKKENHE